MEFLKNIIKSLVIYREFIYTEEEINKIDYTEIGLYIDIPYKFLTKDELDKLDFHKIDFTKIVLTFPLNNLNFGNFNKKSLN